MTLTEIRLRIARFFAPEGFAVVPVEPTKAMIKAACASMSPGKRPTPEWLPVAAKHRIRYQAMINAGTSLSPT